MAKPVNYTAEMTATAIEMYSRVVGEDEATRSAMVKEIAVALKKNERSVRSKLSREGVYVAKKVVSKVTGETPAKKDALATTLRDVSGVNVNVENVAKMNKVEITRFIEAFKARDEAIAVLHEELNIMADGDIVA